MAQVAWLGRKQMSARGKKVDVRSVKMEVIAWSIEGGSTI